MTDFTQTIREIEEEIRRTPYHKGTEHHIGKLRARLANLKDRVLNSEIKSGGGGGKGYAVKKTGDASVALIGPPSVGKSTLLNKLTNAESKVAAYAFTTISVIPGMMFYKNAYIQIFDIPGLIEGAAHGKGRGKEVLSVARNSDLLIIISDVDREDSLFKMSAELEEAGIRINKEKPNILIEKTLSGGVAIHSNIKQDLRVETIKEVAQEMGLKNGNISLKEKINLDALIDAFSSSRVYLPGIFVLNKADKLKKGYQKKEGIVYISAEKEDGLSFLKEKIWKSLGLINVYLVHPDEEPGFNNPIIVKKNDTLKDVAQKIGQGFAVDKKYAKIWGEGARFPEQEVSLTTKVQEGMQIRFL